MTVMILNVIIFLVCKIMVFGNYPIRVVITSTENYNNVNCWDIPQRYKLLASKYNVYFSGLLAS